jgi:hypothetical protein
MELIPVSDDGATDIAVGEILILVYRNTKSVQLRAVTKQGPL